MGEASLAKRTLAVSYLSRTSTLPASGVDRIVATQHKSDKRRNKDRHPGEHQQTYLSAEHLIVLKHRYFLMRRAFRPGGLPGVLCANRQAVGVGLLHHRTFASLQGRAAVACGESGHHCDQNESSHWIFLRHNERSVSIEVPKLWRSAKTPACMCRGIAAAANTLLDALEVLDPQTIGTRRRDRR
jgi:hypothetical protein